MVQVDIPAAFAMGQVIALAAKNSLKKEQSLNNRFLLFANWYASFILAPVGFYLLVGWPGWETMYQWKWVEEPKFHPFTALFSIFFLISMVGLSNIGFIITHYLIKKDKDRLAKIILAIALIASLSPFLIDIKAPLYVGTYDEYHSGKAQPVFGTPFLWAWFFVMLYWVIGSVWMVLRVYRMDKR